MGTSTGLNEWERNFLVAWISKEKEKIRILELEGFTKQEAIEMLKVQAMQGIGRHR